MKVIVVGYDETEAAKRALARAAQLATAFEAKVIVTSVAQVLGGSEARRLGLLVPVDPPEIRRAELEHAAAFLREQGIDAEYIVGLGDPATEILELAESQGADLIVVGTRETRLLERLIDPSVSGSVQRRAHCDVLIVH